MKMIIDWINNALTGTQGWATWGVVGFIFYCCRLLIKRLYNHYRNCKTSRELVEYQFNPENVQSKTQYYIETRAQNITPSIEDEPGTSGAFIVRKPLIPFFIEEAFRKKEENRFYLVLADSGMGKTTFMINLYWRYTSFFNFKKKYKIKLLPFGDTKILDNIKKIKKKEDPAKTILLLDAFDEYNKLIPPDTLVDCPESNNGNDNDKQWFDKVLNEVIDSVCDFRKVVMTCRTQYFPEQNENKPYKLEIRRHDDKGNYELVKMYLSPFDDHDINRYLDKKYGKLNIRKRRKKAIASQIVHNSKKLMVRPMLLNYIEVLVDSTKRYSNTYQIYQALVDGWINREVKKREDEHNDSEKFRQSLHYYSRQIALRIYEKRKETKVLYLSRKDATDVNVDLQDYHMTGESLMTRDAENNWKFSHKSILEFFLAKEAAENPDFAMKLDFTGMDMVKQFCSEAGIASLVLSNYVRIERDEFLMGSPDNERGRENIEMQHSVTLSDYYMCKYAVTIADFKRFIEELKYQTEAEKQNSSRIWDGKAWIDKTGINWRHGVSGEKRQPEEYNHPVLHVSWNDATAYCSWLSSKTGKTYRLPTEAEWEYACRAGTTTPFSTGENLTTKQANYNGNFPYNKHPKGEYRNNTVAVESLEPNAFGLYNMHGNVWEWCTDWYGESFYDECKAKGIVENPIGPATGSYRVIRGGSWNRPAEYCRSAYRYYYLPGDRSNYVGFRLVFVP